MPAAARTMTPSFRDVDGDADGAVLEFSGRHVATYWISTHLEGLRRVLIPETALFDSEGVLEAWIYPVGVRNQVCWSKSLLGFGASSVFSLMYLLHDGRSRAGVKSYDAMCSRQTYCASKHIYSAERRLSCGSQDLAQDRQTDVVAVHRVDEPEYLDESSLDALVRVLCTRELAMNAASPDLRIPRAFPGGGNFCLQEFVPFSDHRLLVVRFQCGDMTLSASSSDTRANDEDMMVDEITARDFPRPRTENSNELHNGRYSFSAYQVPRLSKLEGSAIEQLASSDAFEIGEKLQAQLRDLVQLVLSHFHVSCGLQLLDVTLEFAHDSSFDGIYLVGAQSVKVRSVPRPTTAIAKPKQEKHHRRKQQFTFAIRNNQREPTKARCNVADDLRARQQASPSHSNYRVCRECRKSQDVELAKELALKQATMRRVLASLQNAQEEREQALQRDLESQETLKEHQRSIAKLQNELDLARASLEAKDGCIQELSQKNAALKMQVANTLEELHVVKARVQLAGERCLQTDVGKQNAAIHPDDTLAQQYGHWDTQNSELQTSLSQLQMELERNQQTLRKLQAKYEEMRADRDELHFQWHFVWRKLIDSKGNGAAPSQRIGGGYQSYPMPPDTNVRDVVKWLVDYDTKRVAVEARQNKSIGKRSKLELEVMRTLGSPKKKRNDRGRSAKGPGSTGSGSRSPSRRSRSPSNKSPPRRLQANDELAAIPSGRNSNMMMTLLAEAIHRSANPN